MRLQKAEAYLEYCQILRIEPLAAINYFRKKFYLRCLIGFWIRRLISWEIICGTFMLKRDRSIIFRHSIKIISNNRTNSPVVFSYPSNILPIQRPPKMAYSTKATKKKQILKFLNLKYSPWLVYKLQVEIFQNGCTSHACLCCTYNSRYSRMDQGKFAENSI